MNHICHFRVEIFVTHSALLDVAEDECTRHTVLIGAATHKVQCDVEGVNIIVVAIIDNSAASYALFYL